MMATIILAERAVNGRLLGSRVSAIPLRDRVEAALTEDEQVVLDFAGTNVTQSFVDELIGSLLLAYGPSLLHKLVFKGCSDDAKAILHFVVSDRLDQLERAFSPH